MDSRPLRRVKTRNALSTTLSRPRGRQLVGTRKPRMAARPPDVERHTGMDFEAGHVHRARNVEEQPPGGMITGGERVTVPGASPDPGGAVSPARSTRASAGERSAEALQRARQIDAPRTTWLQYFESRGAGRPIASKACRSAEEGACPV